MLFTAGLETDATSVLRTMSELAIDFDWLWHRGKDERIRRFVEFVHVHNHRKEKLLFEAGHLDEATKERLMAGMEEILPDGVRTVDEFEAWREKEYERVRGAYKGHSWSDRSIRQRAQDVGLDDMYELVFRTGSEAVHSGAPTLTGLSSLDGATVSVSAEPTVPVNAATLGMACACFLHLGSRAAQRIGLTDRDVVLEELGDDVRRAFYDASA